MSRARIAAIVAVTALAAVLAFFSLRASPYLQYVPWMPRRIGIWADSHGISRNFVAFFVLGLATFVVVGRGFWVILSVALFGTAVEVAQLWIPSRAYDPKDIAASVAGAIAAWPIAWLITRRRAA